MPAVIIFILGLMIGSFLNVVIYRLPKGESIVFPASHCPECGTKLAIWDLIPVLSFIFNKGKCRYCNKQISYQYPAVEVLTGLIFFILYWKYNLNSQFIIYAGLVSSLLVISMIDIKKLIIPNQITYPGILIGLISSFLNSRIGFLDSLLGILLPGLFLFLIAVISRGGLGIGDVKLTAMLGSFIGVKYTFISIFLGSILGSILSIMLILLGVKGWKSKLPFGVFISLGGLLMILWGREIINIYWQLILN